MANDFDWSGGHPALDLVNTLDERPSGEPAETLATYDDLIRFSVLAGLIDKKCGAALRQIGEAKGARIVVQVRGLRENLFSVLAGANQRQQALDAIEDAIQNARASRQMISPSSGKLARWTWRQPDAAEVPFFACALAAEDLLINADASRIRKCSASDCEVYFLDTSKGHRRQWCSMQNCGNRAKQRRWRTA